MEAFAMKELGVVRVLRFEEWPNEGKAIEKRDTKEG